MSSNAARLRSASDATRKSGSDAKLACKPKLIPGVKLELWPEFCAEYGLTLRREAVGRSISDCEPASCLEIEISKRSLRCLRGDADFLVVAVRRNSASVSAI